MIKLSVFYPAQAGSRFDVDYYCNHHMPLVQKTFGAICKGVAATSAWLGVLQELRQLMWLSATSISIRSRNSRPLSRDIGKPSERICRITPTSGR